VPELGIAFERTEARQFEDSELLGCLTDSEVILALDAGKFSFRLAIN
jgi:hypothetical protein